MNVKDEVRGLIGRPCAFVPVAMSLVAFAVVMAYLLMFGVARQTDEGAAAHTWQLLVGAQLPLVAWFVMRWLPRAPRATLCVFALQIAAMGVAAAPVLIFRL